MWWIGGGCGLSDLALPDTATAIPEAGRAAIGRGLGLTQPLNDSC